MKKMYLFMLFLIATNVVVNAQYLFQDFEAAFTGAIPAPAGSATTIPANAAGDWTQTRQVSFGDGISLIAASTTGQKDWQRNTFSSVWTVANGTSPTASFAGNNALFIEDRFFGSNCFGSRRVESPAINLSSSTSPYIRFKYFNANTGSTYNLRVVAFDPALGKWRPILIVQANGSSNWTPVALKVPSVLKTAGVKFGLELTSTFGSNNTFIDNFSVDEFTPATITSAATGNWNATTTWVGGVVPTGEENIAIATGHTVTNNARTRCQNLSVTGIMQGSTTANDFVEICGDLTINSGGVYRSFNGTTGRVTMLAGSLINNGTCDFASYTAASGAVFTPGNGSTMHSVLWLCGGEPATIDGSGTFTTRTGGTSQFYNIWCANSGGVTFNKPIVVGRSIGLYYGAVNPNTNLTIGEALLGTSNVIERAKGSFTSAPIWASGITLRSNHYVGPFTASTSLPYGWQFLSSERDNITTGEEIETISGNKQILGALLMNTFDNITLGNPVYLGNNTSGASLTLTKGIIVSSAANPLIFNPATSGVAGTHPSNSTVSTTSFPSNQGSFVNGPIRIITLSTTSGTKTLPLGVGNSFVPISFTGVYGTAPNYNIDNLRKTFTIAPGGAGTWSGTDFTVNIDAAPIATSYDVAPTPIISRVQGNRSYKLVYNNTVALPTTTIVSLIGHKSGIDGGGTVTTTVADNFTAPFATLRLMESTDNSTNWANRNSTNTTTGSGTLSSGYFNSSTQTAFNASTSVPAIGDDWYFAWGSIAPLIDVSPTAIVAPTSTQLCYGNAETVTVTVTNTGLNTIDFSVNNLTTTVNVTGATTATLSGSVTTGTLASGATINVVISATLDMTAAGAYSIAATTALTSDGNAANDNLTAVTRTVTAPVITTVQPSSATAIIGSQNIQILQFNFTSNKCGNVTLLDFNTTGSTNATTDVIKAKVYYTGNSSTFATTTQFGADVANPNGAFSVMGTQALVSGTNYFWLVYDVNCSATAANVLDASLSSLTFSGTTYTPATPNPSGTRAIAAGSNFITIANGDWGTSATWQCGNIPPTNATGVTVAHAVVVNTTGNIAGSVTINTGASLTIATGGELTLGVVGGGNRTLNNNGTLAITGGNLNVNGNVALNTACTFNMSSGNFNIDPNDGTTAGSVATGTTILAVGSSTSSISSTVTGGNILINDPPFVGTGYTVFYTPDINLNWPGCTIQFGGSTNIHPSTATNGFRVDCYFNSGRLGFGNVIVNGNNSAKPVTDLAFGIGVIGDLTINANSELRTSTNLTIVGGNILNNGTLSNTGGLTLGLLNGTSTTPIASTLPQSIGGSGVFRNLLTSPTAEMSGLIINNASATGVTLNVPIAVSGTLSITRGVINTTASNLLTLGYNTTNAGTLSYTTGRVNGPFKRWITAVTGARQFPVGNATWLQDANINFTTAPTTAGSLTAQWVNASPNWPNATPLNEGALVVDTVAGVGYWLIDAADGLAGGAYTGTFKPLGTLGILDFTKNVLVKRPSAGGNWVLDGTHVTTIGSNAAPTFSRTGMVGFSQFAIGGQLNITLPISIEYFAATKQANTALINWKVAANNTALTYEILKSTDGRNFTTITTQNAIAGARNYNTTDANLANGANYYKLKATDRSGAITYSAVAVVYNNTKGFEIVSLIPTLIRGYALVSIGSDKAINATLIVTDMQGKTMLKKAIGLQAGTTDVTIDANKFAVGAYMLRAISSNGATNAIRFVKQ